MAISSSADHGKRARWQTLWHTLHAVRFEPLPTDTDIDQVLAALPKHLPGETLPERLRRAGRGSAARRSFTRLAEFERWAAGSTTEAYPLPETPMVSLDEAFRLTVTLLGDLISLRVETLGLAAFDYLGQTIGLALHDGSDVLVEFELDEDGNGEASVEDNEQARLALVRPQLVLIESGNGG